MTTTKPGESSTVRPRYRVHRRRWFTVLTAMATTTAAWAVAVPLLGVDLAVRRDAQNVQQIEAFAVTLTSLVAGLAGWGLLALLERRTSNALPVWRVIAVVTFVLSLLGPLNAVTLTVALVLLGMHTAVAAILLWGMPRSTTTPRRADAPVRNPRIGT